MIQRVLSAVREAFLDIRRDPWLIAPAAALTLVDVAVNLTFRDSGPLSFWVRSTSGVVTGSASWTAYALRSRRAALEHAPGAFLLFFLPGVALWVVGYALVSAILGGSAGQGFGEGVYRLYQAAALLLAVAGVVARLAAARGIPALQQGRDPLEAWTSGWRLTRRDLPGSAALIAVMTLLTTLVALVPELGWLALLNVAAGTLIAQAVIVGGAKRL